VNADALDPLRPRRPGGMGRGAMFALGVHVVLLIAIAFGVSWRSSEPAGVTAELWAAVPEVAAPAPVAPPQPEPPKVEPKPEPKVEPPPPKPEVNEAEIALEKAKAEKARQRERIEREEREAKEKIEALRKQRELAQKLEREKAEKQAKAEKAEAERVAKLREENLRRIQGLAGATGAPQSTGTAQRDAGPSANYAGRIVARVRPHIILTDSVPATLRAEGEVRSAPDGTILSRRLVKPSGNATWDEAVLRAIDRTETLPKDDNGRVPSSIVIGFTPV
jgi:colicin import membrane protein